ncbi:hypothetical protein TUBRATIS_19940 [Tubulinosema ratisbonensis]|uniref:Uncharacterized protein n=1 Tax=Tubulinosema ratisbonensis TaxID=291195 RepID=A0A437AK76_9MICR|nr:hypothetical protein TUBRATIS_19940 [Tubulinosema ratisbonensis]
MNLIKILLSLIGLFCVFLTIGGYNLRDKPMTNNTSNQEMWSNSYNISENEGEQRLIFEEDNDLLNNQSFIIQNGSSMIYNENKPENTSLILDENFDQISKTNPKEEKHSSLKEKKDLKINEPKDILLQIINEEKENVTNNQIFLERITDLTGKINNSFIDINEIIQRFKKSCDSFISKNLYDMMVGQKKGYFELTQNLLNVLYKVKNSQLKLTNLYLEKKGINFILSSNSEFVKELLKEKYEEFNKTYVTLTDNIATLYYYTITTNDKISSICRIMSDLNRWSIIEEDIKQLINSLIVKELQTQKSMTALIQNINYKLDDGVVLMKNYYKLCKEKYDEKSLSVDSFNLCKSNVGSISAMVERIHAVWKFSELEIKKILSVEFEHLERKGIKVN